MRGKLKEGKRSRQSVRKAHRSSLKSKLPATEVSVTFRHVEPSSAIRAYALRKFSYIAKFLKRACEVHLILTVDKYRQRGEVTVKSGRLAVTAQEQTKDL